MSLQELRDALCTIEGVEVYHFKAEKPKGNYIVWAEDGEGDATYASNTKIMQELEGTIDYFTKVEFDPNFEVIQEKLNSIDVTWRLNSIQHEDDTSYIHYEWVWRMIL